MEVMADTTVRLASIYGSPCGPWAIGQSATKIAESPTMAVRTRLPNKPRPRQSQSGPRSASLLACLASVPCFDGSY